MLVVRSHWYNLHKLPFRIVHLLIISQTLGGAILFDASSSQLSLINPPSYLYNNSAIFGGAMVTLTTNLNNSSITYENNSLVANGNQAFKEGGVLYIGGTQINSVLKTLCSLPIASNSAKSGKVCASHPIKLQSSSTGCQYVWPGQILTISLTLRDVFDNTWITSEKMLVVSNVTNVFQSNQQDDTLYANDEGIFQLDSAFFYQASNISTIKLTFSISVVFGRRINYSFIRSKFYSHILSSNTCSSTKWCL